MQTILYAWRIRDVRMHHGRKKKWRALTWKMTETQALAWASRHSFEIQRVEGSQEPGALCASEALARPVPALMRWSSS